MKNSILRIFIFLTLHVSFSQQKPNIVFILADDLGWQDVGFNGSNWFETPNLDKLAEKSVVFKNSYMYSTCSPSRAAIFTGKHSYKTNVYNVPVLEKGNNTDNLYSTWTVGLEHEFYSKPLNEAGYKLIHLGKYHVVGPDPLEEKKLSPSARYKFYKKFNKNGNLSWVDEHKTNLEVLKYYPLGKGFHKNIGGTWWGDPAKGHKKGYNSVSGGYFPPFQNPFIEEKESDAWLTDRLTDEAISFMDENKNQPFFVNLHYYAPHRPSKPYTAEMLQKYKDKLKDDGTGQVGSATKEIAAYATLIERMDYNVQRIVDYLEANNLSENTMIVFTSDNGFNSIQSVSKNLRGFKGSIYQGGVKVPTFVYWKGKITPAVTDTNITAIDYFPTFLDVAGIRDTYDGDIDGDSFYPLLKGQDNLHDRTVYFHIASNYKNPAATLMYKGDWKLIQFLKSTNIELYHLKDDPAEKNNLANSNNAKADELLQEMQTWRALNNVPLPTSSPIEDALDNSRLTAKLNVNIYPTLISEGVVYVDSDESKQITLYDMMGKELMNFRTSSNTINVTQLVSGHYYLKVNITGKERVKKIIID